MKSRRRSQRGFTLVELMVSLTLFSVLITGVLAVAVSMAQAYKDQRQVVSTEGSVRGAMDFIADAVRGASPAVSSGNIEDLSATTTGTCVKGSIAVTSDALQRDMLDVVVASGGVVTSVRTPYTPGAGSSTVTDASNLAVNDTLLITDGLTGHLARIQTVDTVTGAITLKAATCTSVLPPANGAYPAGSLAIRAIRARFYIDTFDGIANVLLMDLDVDGINPEPLAEDIEDMQIAVGVDVNADKGIDNTEWAFSAATPGPLVGPVRALRITLIAKGAKAMSGIGPIYTRPLAEDHTLPGAPDANRRRVLKSTIEIRNLKDSP